MSSWHSNAPSTQPPSSVPTKHSLIARPWFNPVQRSIRFPLDFSATGLPYTRRWVLFSGSWWHCHHSEHCIASATAPEQRVRLQQHTREVPYESYHHCAPYAAALTHVHVLLLHLEDDPEVPACGYCCRPLCAVEHRCTAGPHLGDRDGGACAAGTQPKRCECCAGGRRRVLAGVDDQGGNSAAVCLEWLAPNGPLWKAARVLHVLHRVNNVQMAVSRGFPQSNVLGVSIADRLLPIMHTLAHVYTVLYVACASKHDGTNTKHT